MKKQQNSITREVETEILDDILLALKEDIGKGDITTDAIIPAGKTISARIISVSPGVICGLDVAGLVFDSVDRRLKFTKKAKDGDKVKAGRVIAAVIGPAKGILTAERTALNFIQRLSGIATLTRKYADRLKGQRTMLLDTRKTTPGLRALEKYAVKTGGGNNHRIGLFDEVLIKDNHISVVGSISRSVELAKRRYGRVEVEAKTLSQVSEAMASGATRIMLDNMSIHQMRRAVRLIRSGNRRIEIEASGRVTLKNIADIAKTGVDFISVGALTHSAPALDINLKV